MAKNPFTISEVGEAGSLRAVADFSCPKCGRHTRFTPEDQDDAGGFTCPHCGLLVTINGPTLADYQRQLDAVNASLGVFVDSVGRKVQKAARDLTEEKADAVERTPRLDEPDPTVH